MLFTSAEELTSFAAQHIRDRLRDQRELLKAEDMALQHEHEVVSGKLSELAQAELDALAKRAKAAEKEREGQLALERQRVKDRELSRLHYAENVNKYAHQIWRAMLDKAPEPMPPDNLLGWELDDFRRQARSIALMAHTRGLKIPK
jgi:hypothetical protein